jgi:class 3 adenylate cyclase
MDEANAAEPSHPMRLRIGVNAGGIMIKEGDIFCATAGA